MDRVPLYRSEYRSKRFHTIQRIDPGSYQILQTIGIFPFKCLILIKTLQNYIKHIKITTVAKFIKHLASLYSYSKKYNKHE